MISDQKRLWVGLCLALAILLSAVLRYAVIDRRPVHHDEGVNAWFVENFVEHGQYQYSPHDYHGPTLYYFGWAVTKVFGRDVSALRYLTTTFGFALCLTPFLLLPEIGFVGVALAIAALGLSPGEVYHSRYAIHEIIYTFFCTFAALSFFRFWRDGKSYWLVMGAFTMASAAATKETVIVWLACMGGAFAATLVGEYVQKRPLHLRERFTPARAAVFLGIVIASMFLWFRPNELLDFFKSYGFYLHLGTSNTGHEKPWHYFPELLWRHETFLVFGALAGCLATALRRDAAGIFLAAWSVLALLGQSVIRYKTPWMVVNLATPLALWSGYAFAVLYAWPLLRPARSLFVAAVVVGLCAAGWKAHYLSFVDFKDLTNKYAYVQTFPPAHDLERKLKKIAADYPTMQIPLVSDENWPYPFLLGKTPQVIMYGQMPESFGKPKIFVIRDKMNQLPEAFLADYDKELYPIRPGLDFQLFIEKGFRL